MLKNIFNFHFILSIIAFIICFNTAIISGDDIQHILKNIHFVRYAPELFGWTPARVFDNYGRTIIAYINEQFYFLLSGFMSSNSFLTAFKIVSAFFYSALIIFSHKVILGCIEPADKTEEINLLVKILIAVILLRIFNFYNQTHLVAYQIPTIIAFYTMVNFSKFKDLTVQNNHIFFMLLYVSAFSLESIALTIFIYSIFWVLDQIKNNKFSIRKYKNTYFSMLIFSLIVNFISMYISLKYSGRISLVKPPLNLIDQFFNSLSYMNSIYLWHKTSLDNLILIILLLYMLYKLYMINFNFNILKSRFLSIFLIFLSSLASVYFISVRSSQNYFLIDQYPWGDLFLIGKLAIISFFVILIIDFYKINKLSANITSLILFIFISFQTVSLFKDLDKQSKISQFVSRTYERIEKDKVSNLIIFEFNADAIPFEVRPLPSDSSAKWFNDGFQTFFERYLGVSQPVKFSYK